MVADQLGDHDRAQQARVDAWESALTLGRQTFLLDMFSHPTMIERELGSFAVDARLRAAVSRRIEARLNNLPGAPHPNLTPFIEALALRALQRSTRSADGDAPLDAADFAPVLAAGDNARGLSSVTRTVLKGLANDFAICAAISQRSRIVGSISAIIDEFKRAYVDQSQRTYGAAS